MPVWGQWLTLMVACITVATVFLRVGSWVERTNTDISNLQKVFDEIQQVLTMIAERLPPKATSSQSPRQLTTLGTRIAIDLDASDWADKTYEQFMNEARQMNPYQIQEFCQSFVFDNEKFKPDAKLQEELESCAFNSGLNVNQVLEVLAIVLRNKLLDELEIEHWSDQD